MSENEILLTMEENEQYITKIVATEVRHYIPSNDTYQTEH